MDRLAELRERRALTLRELAEMSGVAADTINQIELGHRKPRPSTLRKLARALEVDVEEFYAEAVLAGKAEATEGGTGRVAVRREGDTIRAEATDAEGITDTVAVSVEKLSEMMHAVAAKELDPDEALAQLLPV